MAASWGENTWSSSGWGGYTSINGNSAAGAVGALTASISIDIGISRFLLEDGSGYLLLEDGSYLMEEAGTGPIPSINGAVGTVAQATALVGVAEASAVGSTAPSTAVASTGVSATGNTGNNPADRSELLVGVAASGGAGNLTPSITVSIVPSWGTGAWGYGSWGSGLAITGSIGSIAYSPELKGVQANGSVGQMTPSITVDIGISRFLLEDGSGYLLLEDGSYLMEEAGTGPIPSVNGAVGTVAPVTSVALDSKWGIGAWGAGTWSSGLLIVGAVNEMIAVSPAIQGVDADGLAGTPVANITVAITGTASQGAAGYLAAVKAALLSGVTATGSVGVLGVQKSYWDIIDDAQNANWTEIDNAQTAAWAAINNAQTAGWAPISNAQTPGWGGVTDAQEAGWELIPTAFDQN
jgi:hypothetical protein